MQFFFQNAKTESTYHKIALSGLVSGRHLLPDLPAGFSLYQCGR